MPATAQNVLGRLESDIREGNGQSAPPAAPTGAPAALPPQKVYLGAMANDNPGGGVRVTSVRDGGPAQQAGLQAQDLVVGAAGKPVQLLRDLMGTLGRMKPGDKVSLDIVRGVRRMRIAVVLAAPPSAIQPADGSTIPLPPTGPVPGQPEPIPSPPTGPGAGRNEPIPPPPGEMPLPSPADGPSLSVPAPPVAGGSQQTQVEELRHRIDQLERRVQDLEKALAEARKK
jgi:hypothetical protein